MWVFWIIAVIAIIFIVKLLLRNDSCTRDSATDVDALEILRQRYANGEIDEVTFEKMKKTLDESG